MYSNNYVLKKTFSIIVDARKSFFADNKYIGSLNDHKESVDFQKNCERLIEAALLNIKSKASVPSKCLQVHNSKVYQVLQSKLRPRNLTQQAKLNSYNEVCSEDITLAIIESTKCSPVIHLLIDFMSVMERFHSIYSFYSIRMI